MEKRNYLKIHKHHMTYNLSVCRQALRFICYSANHVHSHIADWVGLSKHDPCRDMLPDVGLVCN